MKNLAIEAVLSLVVCASCASAAEPITLATVQLPAEISADEPYIAAFSLEQAARSLDTAALDWQKTHACTSCHTMFPYLMARPALRAIAPQSAEVRTFFEQIVQGQREAMPNYTCDDVEGAVAIGMAAALALNDRGTTGKLHPLTRQALDRMWMLQRSDGGWDWPFRDTPPLKVDRHYGATLAAIATGMAPENYAQTPSAQAGLAGIRRFLTNTPPVSLHQQAMLLWASAHVENLWPAAERNEVLTRLLARQRPDGGWSMANLVDNSDDLSRKETDELTNAQTETGYGSEFLLYVGRDKIYKSSLTSDGYATGFVIYVARQAGLAAGDSRLQQGIRWLKGHQRASGRWFTPSQAWHSQHLISNAGTGYAVLALEACGEVPATALPTADD